MDFGDILDEWDNLRDRGLHADRKSSQVGAKPAVVQERRPAISGNTRGQDGLRGQAPAKGRSGDTARAAQQAWLDRHGVADKDMELAVQHETSLHRFLTRKEIDGLPVDAVLDLHGMTALAAEEALEGLFEAAERRSLRKVLIIHGKGIHSRSGPVLADIVRRWLERHPAAGRTGSAHNPDGGSGATWVLLKRR